MIVAITKGNFAKGLINYHEKKVERGVGELIVDTTFSRNKHERISEFMDLADLNKTVKRDRYAHISVSFCDEDSVNREKQLQIAERYLEGMGYGDAPRLIYEHRDSAHRHFHIVTSTIALDGRKINLFRDHFRNQELSRRIEKEFGLTVTEYFRQSQEKLQALNAQKYSFLKGIEKLYSSEETKKAITNLLGQEILQRILKEKLCDQDIKSLLTQRDPTLIERLLILIRNAQAEYKTDKERLIERLRIIRKASRSRDDFVRRCEDNGLYVRKIAGQFGTARFTYGLKETNFYLAEKDLPQELRHDYLFTGKQLTKSFDESSQKKFLKRIVSTCLKQSSSIDDFESRMLYAGVRIIYASNARGIYGISFISENIKDAIAVKGSDVGVSWSKLQAYHIQIKNINSAVFLPEKTSTKPANRVE